jgi:hypothetical protein
MQGADAPHPRTGEEIAILASKSVKFTPAESLKESLEAGPAKTFLTGARSRNKFFRLYNI